MFQLFGTSTEQVVLNSIPFDPEPPIEYYPYKCKRCPRSFSSTQALGGHQSTHRKEKEKNKGKGKKQQKVSLKGKKKRAKPQPNKPKKSKPKTLSARHLELKLTLEKPRRKNKKVKNEVPCWSGLCSRCNEEVASSWMEDVAKYTLNSMDLEPVLDHNLPQKKITNEAKERKNDQPLDLSLKL